jgi:hypothetical protein
MNTPHPLCEILFAIANGYTVQLFDKSMPTDWFDWSPQGVTPLDVYANEYLWRIKPEPKPDFIEYYYVRDAGALTGVSSTRVQYTFDGETGKLKSAEVLK